MPTRIERNDTVPQGMQESRLCLCCGNPLKHYLADYHRFVHIRCQLSAVPGWTPPQGQPHYVW